MRGDHIILVFKAKDIIKSLLAIVFYYSGIFHLIRIWHYLSGKRLTVLTLHRVANEKRELKIGGLPTITISAENFERLLKFIKKHYRIIFLAEYLEIVNGRKKPRAHCLMISFDDAYKEMVSNVLPILNKYDLTAILFIPTAAVDDGGFFWWDAAFELLAGSENCDRLVQQFMQRKPANNMCSNIIRELIPKPKQARTQAIYNLMEVLQYSSEIQRQEFINNIMEMYDEFGKAKFRISKILDWHEIDELQKAGIELGSHTKNHRFLSTIPAKDVKYELTESKRQLEDRFHIPINSFAYPGGKYSAETVSLVKEAGFACAFTSDTGLNSFHDDVFTLKRINIWDREVTGGIGKFSKAITAWSLFLKG
jgi:peptidoglycan/xylan/chitin deacetylase (PgdA/CDA1 family)